MTSVSHKSFTRNLFCTLIGASALFLAALPASARMGLYLQMQLGNPTGATADTNNHNHYLIQRTVEAIDYNDTQGQPNWASWDLTSGDVGSSGRTDAWAVDTSLPPNFNKIPINTFGTINGQSYDRGHMCPSADRTSSVPTNELVFLMSNIIPQASSMNQGVWATIEDYCRSLDTAYELLIMCGPYNFGPTRADSGLVGIASNAWKIIVCVPLGGTETALSRITNADPNTIRVIAVEIPNADGTTSTGWQSLYVTSVKKVQADTGYNFFSALPNNLAWVLRSKVDGQAPTAPGAITFSPSSGAVNSSLTITGTALDTVTNVAFNGTVASYNIDSPTQITATVPTGATSGSVTVKGLGGNATSGSSFTVTGSATADLAITTTHTGNFTQGDAGDTYTIIVTNSGTAASSGAVTVADALPASLTATAISGTGWTADLGTLTCTRSDALAAGAIYPAITVTVNVSAGAPASVTNATTVSGGGDANPANNTATDPTTITAAAAPAATTMTATSVGTATATLNGTVNPNGKSSTAQFQYGLTTGYGSIAPVSGTLTGPTAQAVSASLSGLASGTTYHFRLTATNTLGGANGLDETFTTATTAVTDLAITTTHAGNFTQGDVGDTYAIVVTNVGTAPSSGTVTVTDALPASLTATAISGTGWTTDLGTLTCTRADPLAGSASYPPITVTVNVSAGAPASVTNTATVSGGGDSNPANNAASDPTTIITSGGSSGTNILVGWDMNALPGGSGNFGPSPFAPTTNAPNLTVVGLTRGSGVGTTGSGAGRAWGGNTWTDTSLAAAIAANRFATASVSANSGYKVSFTTVTRFDYRHSATGPTSGALQYAIGAGAFTSISNLSYGSGTVTNTAAPIDLSSIAALQNVGAGTNVTFRIVNWGATSSAGTWYIFDTSNSLAPDFAIQGTVSPVVAPVADLTISMTHAGSFTQGDIGDTYTITITNVGPAATVGAVSVNDALPAGLTATAVTGAGWSSSFIGTPTCTRSDSLAAGAGYPPITVTVNVSASAPASITNTAGVSGGGESNTANNTASNPTAIIPLTPIQSWRLQWFGTTANSGPAVDTAIATGDGMPNLLKYALGLNPLVPTNNPVVGEITTGYLRLTSPKNPAATDVTFYVEVAGDLTTPGWTTNGTTVDQNTSTLLQVHDNTPVDSSASGYMRLRITRP